MENYIEMYLEVKMNKTAKLVIWLLVIMVVSFFISGLFFMSSKLINVETGNLNYNVVYEFVNFSNSVLWMESDWGIEFNNSYNYENFSHFENFK
jgi:hypothetical protein